MPPEIYARWKLPMTPVRGVRKQLFGDDDVNFDGVDFDRVAEEALWGRVVRRWEGKHRQREDNEAEARLHRQSG